MISNGFVDQVEGIDAFPGDFDSSPQLVKTDVEINSYQYDWFATGYYLPARQEATIKVNNYSYSPLNEQFLQKCDQERGD